jgi:hypothetical protein
MVLAGVRDRLARPAGARLMVVIDEAPFAARMAGAPAAHRGATRARGAVRAPRTGSSRVFVARPARP